MVPVAAVCMGCAHAVRRTKIGAKVVEVYTFLFGAKRINLFCHSLGIANHQAWLGRMLGDLSPLWGIPIGALFVWLGLSLVGVQLCTLPSGRYGSIKMRGYGGAMLETVLNAVVSISRTGQVGDGKIFISDVMDAIRIRTGERGDEAL